MSEEKTMVPFKKWLYVTVAAVVVSVALSVGITVGVMKGNDDDNDNTEATSLLQELDDQKALEEERLAIFDDLDYNVFTNQKWDELGRSHHEDIVVHWPDGRITTGRDTHVDDLDFMFTYAPDTNILEHPIRFAFGDYTAVTGILRGTFSEPMAIGDGQFIEPTGNTFEITMATIGRWEGLVMVEEFLFWDNQTFMKQIGLA